MNRVWPADGDAPVVEEGPPSSAPWIVWLGLAVVLAAAAVLSFDELRDLALAVRIDEHLAWLLPITIDAGAAVSCATWLGARTDARSARFASWMTWALLAVTVAGNAGQLGMHAMGILPPWQVAVLVGTIPPAVVGSTVHLLVLLVRTSKGAGPDQRHQETTVVRQQSSETDRDGVGTTDGAHAPERADQSETPARSDGSAAGPDHADQSQTPIRLDQTTDTEDPAVDDDELDDEALVARLVEWSDREGSVPSRERVRIEFRIGTRRAERIRDAVRPAHDMGVTA